MGRLSPFKQGLVGGLIAVAVALLIYVVSVVAAWERNPQDAVDDAGEEDLLKPLAINSMTDESVLDPVLWVFQTTTTYNGAGPAGYGRTGMHEACRADDPASHFCTLQEIETAWKAGGVNLALSSQAWVDNAVVGTINSDFSGDVQAFSDWYGGSAVGDYPYNCTAWTTSTNTARGLILNSGVISPATEACDDIHPVACCKRVITYHVFLPMILR